MKVFHGVYIAYGVTRVPMSADVLQLIADALEAVNPDSERQLKLARKWASAFLGLSEYADSVKAVSRG